MLAGAVLLGLLLPAAPVYAQAATANGSRVCDASRVALAAIDAGYTLTNNTHLIIYAAGANDGDCRFRSPETHTLQCRELPAGTFADVPTSSGTGPFVAVSGTVRVNGTL